MFGKTKWYISGAVSSDPNFREKFAKAEAELKSRGYKVINPVKGEKDGKPWQYYMKKDIKKLLKCNGIFLLPDWKTSEGACLEYMIAKSLDFYISRLDS